MTSTKGQAAKRAQQLAKAMELRQRYAEHAARLQESHKTQFRGTARIQQPKEMQSVEGPEFSTTAQALKWLESEIKRTKAELTQEEPAIDPASLPPSFWRHG